MSRDYFLVAGADVPSASGDDARVRSLPSLGAPRATITPDQLKRARRIRAFRELLDDDTAPGHDLAVQIVDNLIELTPPREAS